MLLDDILRIERKLENYKVLPWLIANNQLFRSMKKCANGREQNIGLWPIFISDIWLDGATGHEITGSHPMLASSRVNERIFPCMV